MQVEKKSSADGIVLPPGGGKAIQVLGNPWAIKAGVEDTGEPIAVMEAMTPLGRIAQPEDIARVIAFFASDDSGFMTGVYAPVNGGLTME